MDPIMESLCWNQPLPPDVRLLYNVFMIFTITVLCVFLIKVQRRFDEVQKALEAKILNDEILEKSLSEKLKRAKDELQQLNERKSLECYTDEFKRESTLNKELQQEQAKKKNLLIKADLLTAKYEKECAQNVAKYQSLKAEKDHALKQFTELKVQTKCTKNQHKVQLDMYKEHEKVDLMNTKHNNSDDCKTNNLLQNKLKEAEKDLANQKQRLTDVKNEVHEMDRLNEKMLSDREQKAYDYYIAAKKALTDLDIMEAETAKIMKGHNCPVDHLNMYVY